MSRRATVTGSDSAGRLILSYGHSGLGGRPVYRPVVGSSVTGLHSAPPRGAQVLVHDDEAVIPFPLATTTVALDGLGALPTLADGETAIFGPHGETLAYATATGPAILYRNKDGTVQLTIDPVTGALRLTHPAGSGYYDNGTLITAP